MHDREKIEEGGEGDDRDRKECPSHKKKWRGGMGKAIIYVQ